MALRKLFVSALWLALVQFLSIVLPVMTVPVVTRAFGPTMFGLLATISASAGYVGLLATFGFNLTGPRATAVLRGEPSKLSAVISNILSAQAVLGAIGTVLFAGAALWIPYTSSHKTIAILILIQVLANSMMPQ